MTDFSKMISEDWKKLPEREKSKWQRKYQIEKELRNNIDSNEGGSCNNSPPNEKTKRQKDQTLRNTINERAIFTMDNHNLPTDIDSSEDVLCNNFITCEHPNYSGIDGSCGSCGSYNDLNDLTNYLDLCYLENGNEYLDNFTESLNNYQNSYPMDNNNYFHYIPDYSHCFTENLENLDNSD